ncbi:MAG: hypothetical protein OXK77_17140 [Gemmatimonadota bacterium]|nr:hypothetical protein [Gemmatimonadota bacterium]MDE2804407.1 hypothetical protein [Gemmatimonadota bacterium]
MTGSRRPGGFLALTAVLVVAAPVRNAEGGWRLADSPAEVAGGVVVCGAFDGAVAAPRDGVQPRLDLRGPVRPGPEYYRFPMVSTKRVPGTGNASGVGEVSFSSSPYGIALGTDGSYRYDFTVRFERMGPARDGTYVVWTTTPELDRIALAGELTDPASFSGEVAWNKFLVVVTLEPAFDPDATMWTGPIVIRGMSRSGMMHTMAGHGPFEEKNCAAYGYE